jgi:UDP-glucuronate decarboxylase
MHPNDGRVVSNFIVQALLGDDITIYGDGAQTRSFCYVDDLIEAMMRLMATDDDVTGPVNIGNPGEFSIHELAVGVLQLTGAHGQVVFKPLPMDDPRQRQPDIGLARHLLGWEPRIQLSEGLERTIAYFRERLLAQQIADLAALARLGKSLQPEAPQAMPEAPAEIAIEQTAGPLAQTA